MAVETAVIGAGLGGLAAAIHLARRGDRVTVFEARHLAGGKAAEKFIRIGSDSWRFDTGPSLITLKDVFEDLFNSCGQSLSDYLDFIELEPICHYFFDDGTRLSSSSDLKHFAQSMEAAGITSEKELKDYLEHASKVWNLTHSIFLENSLHDLIPMLKDPRFWKSLYSFGKIGAFKSLDKLHRQFFSSPKARQFFNRYATYNGSHPYRAPSTFSLIPHVEYGIGAWAPRGGIHAIPKALEKLAIEMGVQFSYQNRVERVELTPIHRSRRKKVAGLHSQSGFHSCSRIICNADVSVFYDQLTDADPAARRRCESLEPSSSAIVFLWCMKDSFPQMNYHNVFFSTDYYKEFQEIFDQAAVPSDPSIYVNISSKITASDAPPGAENWFILINAPIDSGQDWSAYIPKLRGSIIRRLGRSLGRDVEKSIGAEEVITPRDIAEETSSPRGSLYGSASNSAMSAFLRHPNFSRKISGLYFVGASVHPGGGMPLVLLSAKIAADMAVRREEMP